MKTVTIDLGYHQYDIAIAQGLLNQPEQFVPYIKGDQVVVISNDVVADLYLQPLLSTLKGKNVQHFIMPDGEVHKTLATAESIFANLLQNKVDRKATIVALGGGVVGDIAGFAAACYQRGINFIQVPTTLLAQVDSSVGGKTAVNHPLGKNMIGAFYQPERVICDLNTIATLPPRDYAAGLAEVVKYALIDDPDFFLWLEQNVAAILAKDIDALAHLIAVSCAHKADIVQQDEREAGVRALLNLGHTFGHAIETSLGYGVMLHGEAVAVGMVMAADMSVAMGDLAESEMMRIKDLLVALGLPVIVPQGISAGAMLDAMLVDKKVQNGVLRLILLPAIGAAEIRSDYSPQQLNAVLERFCQA